MRLLMAGSLRAIHVPSVTQEAARDLVRAREALRQDLMRARHRVSKLLLRYGRVYPQGARHLDGRPPRLAGRAALR